MKDWGHHRPCLHCGKEILMHNVCHHCGWYKGQPIFLRAINRHQDRLARAAAKQEQASSTEATSAS
jgi:hypothetical protein